MSNALCEDLILDIFSRLPTKSLLRFRSVSKSLCVRIRSPTVFIRLHTLRSPEKVMNVHRLHWSRGSYDPMGTGVFGVGFDPLIDDYKILRITPKASFIYTMKTHTWREIASPATPFTFVKYHPCLFNGALHWAVKRYLSDARDKCCYYIMKFDLSSEVFSMIELRGSSWETNEVTIINGCLAAIRLSPRDHTWIWMRREYNNSTASSCLVSISNKNTLKGAHRVVQITPNDELLYIVYPNKILAKNLRTGVVSRMVNLSDYPTSLVGKDMCLESIGLLDMGTSCEGNCNLCKFRFYHTT